MIAVASVSVAWTSTGASELGRTWLTAIRADRPRSAVAAVTYSVWAWEINEPGGGRAKTGTEITPTAISTVARLGPRRAAALTASSRLGIARSMSTPGI